MDGLTAAVDLGSNSFHLLVATDRDGELTPVERIKEKVQLGKGLRDGTLADDAVARGLASIERMAQRLRAVPRERLAVVGTSAIRVARNRDAFIRPAEALLGCPIRVLSGTAEAELIFLGVSHAITADESRRLVIDVGGGSTEIAAGEPFVVEQVGSLELGCVVLMDRCFDAVREFAASYRQARRTAVDMLAASGDVARFRSDGYAEVIGTSGTAESVLSVLSANGWSQGRITAEGIDRIEQAILERRWVSEAGVPGLEPERTDIFPAGLAVVAALFEVLQLREMRYLDASLQDGLLYDLCGRRHVEDVRARSIANWQRKCRVDVQQVARVRRTALRLLAATRAAWELDGAWCLELLTRATDLHEIGLAVSARHHHRHGAYLVQNADLPGFAAEERQALAFLVRGHRGGFPAFSLAAFTAPKGAMLKRLLVLLRLAVVLERTRRAEDSPQVGAVARMDELVLELPRGWLNEHALSRAELLAERQRLAQEGLKLEVAERG